MFDRVIKRFFEGEENVMANLRAQRPGWNADGEIEAAAKVERIEGTERVRLSEETLTVAGDAMSGQPGAVGGRFEISAPYARAVSQEVSVSVQELRLDLKADGPTVLYENAPGIFELTVTNVLQTSSGRLIFGRPG